MHTIPPKTAIELAAEKFYQLEATYQRLPKDSLLRLRRHGGMAISASDWALSHLDEESIRVVMANQHIELFAELVRGIDGDM